MTKVQRVICLIILMIAIVALYVGAVYLGLYIGEHYYRNAINWEGEIYGTFSQR